MPALAITSPHFAISASSRLLKSAPLTAREIAARLPAGCDVPEAIARLRRKYADRGVHLVRVG